MNRTEPQKSAEEREHRCVTCGALQPETKLYLDIQNKDWACVDPAHPAGAPRPIREDYNELTVAFARILFEWQLQLLGLHGPNVSDDLREAAMMSYFQTDHLAYRILIAMVSIAMQKRERWGKTQQQRDDEDAREVARVMQVMEPLRGSGFEPYESPMQKPQPFGDGKPRAVRVSDIRDHIEGGE